MENDFVLRILTMYSQGYSVKRISKELDVYCGRVTKILTTNGIVINDTHAKILEYHKNGLQAKEISDKLNISVKTVQRYLPASRPVYKINRSKNALRIALCREKKKG